MEASTVPRAAPAGVSGILSPRLLRVASDAHLVDLIREGRGVAFETLYDRHHRSILSFCRHMLGSAEEAEDAVQHTFLAAYNDLISTDRPMHLRAWLFTIARNRCYSILRARREQPVAQLVEPATEGLAAQVERRQDLRDLVVDLGRLPDEQRAALVLSEMDSLSHEQIGGVLGVPKDKVKALVFQARESLIASRNARETDCAEIREQLANLRGGALRRSNLRRHLRECPGCREFRDEVDCQRHQLRLLLPVVPTIALKEGVLGTTVGGGAGATASAVGGGTIAGSVFKGGVLKGLVGAALAGVGTAGTIVAVHDIQVSTVRATHHYRAAISAKATGRSAHIAAPAVAAAGRPAVAATSTAVAAASTHSRSFSAPAASRQFSRASKATLVEVLHPLSPTGLVGSKPIISPLVPVAPAGVTPAPPSGQSGTSGNSPYIGTGTFGTGSQPAPTTPASSSSSPTTTTPSAPAGTQPSTPSTPTTSGSGTPGSNHTTGSSGGGHFVNPVGGGSSTRDGGPAASHGSIGSTSSGTTPSNGQTTTTTSSTPTQTTTSSTPAPTTTTTTTTSAPPPTEPTGGGRSGGSGIGTGTGSGGTGSGTGTGSGGPAAVGPAAAPGPAAMGPAAAPAPAAPAPAAAPAQPPAAAEPSPGGR